LNICNFAATLRPIPAPVAWKLSRVGTTEDEELVEEEAETIGWVGVWGRADAERDSVEERGGRVYDRGIEGLGDCRR
jgi:hypothetical protein